MASRAPDNTCIDRLLSRWLQHSSEEEGELPPASEIIARMEHHGVVGLLSGTLSVLDGIPDDIVEFVRDQSIAFAYWEAQHARYLANALDLMGYAGATPLVFKGTALAYSAYEAPFMRVRGDSDVIVAPADFAAACAALDVAGYSVPYSVRGTLVSAVRVYRAPDPAGDTHDIDLHQRVSNHTALARLFPFEELQERSQPLPALSRNARAVGPLDALMIACFHRKVHAESPYFINGTDQHDPNRMIWLADIDKLTRALPDSAWAHLASLCGAKGLGTIVAEGISEAQKVFATPLPTSSLQILVDQPAGSAAARYLAAGLGRRTFLNFRATPGIIGKCRFFAELFFPNREYVRAMFPHARLRWMPWLYVRYIGGRSLHQLLSRRAPHS